MRSLDPSRLDCKSPFWSCLEPVNSLFYLARASIRLPAPADNEGWAPACATTASRSDFAAGPGRSDRPALRRASCATSQSTISSRHKIRARVRVVIFYLEGPVSPPGERQQPD